MLAEGMSTEEILGAYPDLEAADVFEALRYTAEAVRERELPLLGQPARSAQRHGHAADDHEPHSTVVQPSKKLVDARHGGVTAGGRHGSPR
jgi:hypothetical protein